jgi:phosphoglucomutase
LTKEHHYRYDYEEVETGADKVMQTLRDAFDESSFVGSELSATTSETTFKVKEAGDFSYTDPIDHSVSKNQGLYIKFEDGSRIIFRLSGTGSQGATIRLYVEKYSKNPEEYPQETAKGLQPLIEVALKISRLEELTSRTKPDVVSVSAGFEAGS